MSLFLHFRHPTRTRTPFHIRVYFIQGVNDKRGFTCSDVITSRCVNLHTHIEPRIRATCNLQPKRLEASLWKYRIRLSSSSQEIAQCSTLHSTRFLFRVICCISNGGCSFVYRAIGKLPFQHGITFSHKAQSTPQIQDDNEINEIS